MRGTYLVALHPLSASAGPWRLQLEYTPDVTVRSVSLIIPLPATSADRRAALRGMQQAADLLALMATGQNTAMSLKYCLGNPMQGAVSVLTRALPAGMFETCGRVEGAAPKLRLQYAIDMSEVAQP